MRTCWLFVVVSVFASAVAFAQAPLVDPAFEAKARAEVAAASAEAAVEFDRGNAAREAGRADDALTAYRKAAALAPNSDHVHRRLCWVLVSTHAIEEAKSECERALSLVPESPYDRSALAVVLMARNAAGDLTRAAELARLAAEAMPTDISVNTVWCQAAVQAGNQFVLSRCSERLLALDPNGQTSNLFGTLNAMASRDYDEAHRLLRKAHDAGLPDPMFESLRDQIDQLDHDDALLPISTDDALTLGVCVVGGWIILMIVLLLIGGSLSQSTLRSIEHATLDTTGTPRERRLRRFYRWLLALAGVYFYLSMPILIVTVLVAGLAVIAIFDEMGGIPIGLLWLIGVTVIATTVAILRSLFARGEKASLGTPIDLAAHPELRAMLDEVAAEIGTRPVDAAYLIPGTDIGVVERGSLWRAFRGKPTERSLILGVALFDGMTQNQLRSILAHEYGHFRNEDTAGGGFALAVRRSLRTLIERMAKSGVAGMFNPAWWFVRAFSHVYLVISQGASRLQEVLADRWAIQAYGSAAFVAGYRHTVARDVEFTQDLDATLKECVENRWGLPNLYDHEPYAKKSEAELAADIEKAMTRKPEIFDSHPAPRQRIELAERLAIVREPAPGDDARVWALFGDPEPVERAMTAVVRERALTTLGIVILETDEEGDDAATAEPQAG